MLLFILSPPFFRLLLSPAPLSIFLVDCCAIRGGPYRCCSQLYFTGIWGQVYRAVYISSPGHLDQVALRHHPRHCSGGQKVLVWGIAPQSSLSRRLNQVPRLRWVDYQGPWRKRPLSTITKSCVTFHAEAGHVLTHSTMVRPLGGGFVGSPSDGVSS